MGKDKNPNWNEWIELLVSLPSFWLEWALEIGGDCMNKIINLVDGYKTYIVAVAMIITGFHNNDLNMVFNGLALVGIRSAMNKI